MGREREVIAVCRLANCRSLIVDSLRRRVVALHSLYVNATSSLDNDDHGDRKERGERGDLVHPQRETRTETKRHNSPGDRGEVDNNAQGHPPSGGSSTNPERRRCPSYAGLAEHSSSGVNRSLRGTPPAHPTGTSSAPNPAEL
jgi:hypothetical protein